MFEVFGRTGPPTLGAPLFLDQRITRNAATRCVLQAYNAAKCDCGRGSAPEPAGRAYSLQVLRGGEGKGRKGEGKGGWLVQIF